MCIDFNPRLREGGDEKDSVKVGESFEFQSTPPRRRRRTVDIVVDIVDNHFNPRLREGGDFSSLSSVDGETISIHASAKEATY